ncbi:hypothetical protein [Actinoplanes sp. NPDC026619]|uniref:hypothetical protein n=1 Tax=Actinoplanes sp. NPDC026619 TaxID=3155798 RepID=UPI00340DDDA8
MKLVADLFDPEPDVWGLRGDPWVWQAMRDHLGDTYLPPSLGEAEAMLYAAFNRIAGVDIATETQQSVYRPEFAHGGMSSGHIHIETWRAELLPLLVDRAQSLL